ncbi:MAG: hypothetical protein HY320_03810 [Armatimonadetes bacterium]|nr:hypothetical protein [Armatimonadota bacterium]
MPRTALIGTLALVLLSTTPGFGQQPSPPAAPVLPAEVQALREELARLQREAEERQKQQEERIRALERQVQALQKRAPAPISPGPSEPGPVTVRPGFKARLYGFARADVDVDSRRMFAGPHLPFWVLSPQDPRAANRTDGDFSIHPRLTRLGLDTEAPPVGILGDAKLTGKLEIDFFNILPDRNSATSNSRAFVRMRHGYGRLDWQRAHFLFGQTWDLISPLFPMANDDVVMWTAGNLGDRRPQLRFVWEPTAGKGKASLGVMVGSPGAVDSQDLDADQVVDGEESRRPTLQARVALNQPSWVAGQTWEAGLWGHSGQFRIDRNKAVSGHRSFNSQALGIDLRLPLTKKLLLQGEGWFGKALADVRGGVGQNINTITGEEVHSHGGWAELLYQFNEIYTLGGGFTIDDPKNEDVTPFTGANQTAVGRTLNRSYYVVNRLNLGSGLTVGIDWMLFHTQFRGLDPGTNNRWNIWLRHAF